MPLHHAVGNGARASRERGVTWLEAGWRHRDIRVAAAGKRAGFGAATKPALFLRPRAWRGNQADIRRRGSRPAEPGGARQPIRDQAARAELAALSPADSGDQALLLEVQHHGDA